MNTLTINKQEVRVESGTTLLAAIESAGGHVPTLCHHPALSAYGACRLCVVEVEAPGRPNSSLQASCAYPALDGLRVVTDSERVKKARRVVAELLLARCPDSELIQRLAREQGVLTTRFAKKNDDCVYCGLCARMCSEKMGRAAIAFSGRGPRRKLEPPFGKTNEACWTCGACDFICPTGKKVSALSTAAQFLPVPNPFNLGLDPRAATYILYPQAVPNKAAIDANVCLRLTQDVCGICEDVCKAKAIDFSQKEQQIELDVGAIVLAPGYECYDARAQLELGKGIYPNVVSALEFERILSASGPYSGHVMRPSDKTVPKRIAFIQCVGSRDHAHDYCSSVCCMYATKEAIIAKEHASSELACDIYFMDLRAYGKGFEEYYNRAKSLGVNYIRCRPTRVDEDPQTHNLSITYLGENDRKVSREYDLVVLSTGLGTSPAARELAQRLGLTCNADGFCATATFAPLDSDRDGIFVAGPFTEPKDIPETVVQASGAAARALALLRDSRGSQIKVRTYPPEIDIRGQEPRIGVFVCHCGTNIGGVVSVPSVVEYARTLDNVVYAEDNLYTCANDTQERIKSTIRERRLNRVIVASCTPRTHEPLFRNTVREAGLNPYLFEMANIRDQCSWVHMHEPVLATQKAKDLVHMAVAKSRLLEPLTKRSVPVVKTALVIGGGLAGMTAALSIADQDYDVALIERQCELGGSMRHLRFLASGEEPQAEMRRIVDRVKAHPRVRVMTDATVEAIDGSVGAFHTKVKSNGTPAELAHGVVVVATGAEEYRPTDYLYGADERVMTQRQLEARLAGADGSGFAGKSPRSVVMIQCVGSRDETHGYCSRLCCTQAIKNALALKSKWPDTAVYILYRDIRTYGFREKYYTRARQQGVIFVRYDLPQKPEVVRTADGLGVKVVDATLNLPIAISADAVVLSVGAVAPADNKTTAQMLKVPLNQDGFFLEAHMKLRPVDFATEGVFLCGMAHAPKTVEESIMHASAAAARAAAVLAQDAMEMEATVSEVIDDRCDGCAYCVDTCPYHAITLFEYMSADAVKKLVETDETACKGCGCCQATCPKNAVFVRGFTLAQIGAQVNAALGG